MSLRTKLLAAIVGLSGTILLLALYLLLRGEASAPKSASGELVSDLVALGGALVRCGDARDRRALGALVQDLEASGTVRELAVVEEAPLDPDAPLRVWNVADFLLEGPAAEEVPRTPRRREVETAFREARRQHGNRWVGDDLLAVVLPGTSTEGEVARRGLVARYVSPPSSRTGIQQVYLVMVVGVVVLTAVSFWLVSRLVVRPLARITEAADRIASGDYGPRLDGRGTNDEFDRTIAAFNRMAREIAEYQGHLEDRVLSALTRMRKAEQHLAIAQRLAATGKLASGVAHEINNPLGGMKNAARALARGDLSPEKTSEYVELIAEGLGRVEETVKKFLSFTPRRLEPRRTDLVEVAQKALALARHRIDRSGARLDLELAEPGTVWVFGDPHELQQVALNLVLNAADAVTGVEDAHVVVRVRARRDEALLEVADNGIGLAAEDQDRCFDLFFTTKEVGEGTGLGLAVAHTIVTNHGGRIEVESAPGQGARFRVALPADEQGAP